MSKEQQQDQTLLQPTQQQLAQFLAEQISQNKKQIQQLDNQIQYLQTLYLYKTKPYGNLLRGFQEYIDAKSFKKGLISPQNIQITCEERTFSLSSVTNNISKQYQQQNQKKKKRKISPGAKKLKEKNVSNRTNLRGMEGGDKIKGGGNQGNLKNKQKQIYSNRINTNSKQKYITKKDIYKKQNKHLQQISKKQQSSITQLRKKGKIQKKNIVIQSSSEGEQISSGSDEDNGSSSNYSGHSKNEQASNSSSQVTIVEPLLRKSKRRR